MRISRRDFLKYCTVAAGALGLTATDLLNLQDALATTGGTKVIWLNGQACTGCTVSLANSAYYMTLQDLTLNYPPSLADADTINLMCIETLSGSMGNQFLPARPTSTFLVAVEGAIPVKNEHYCDIANTIQGSGLSGPISIYDAVNYYTSSTYCAGVLAIGTCASYGGIPGGAGNITGAKGVYGAFPALKDNTICIPGCPPNPNWIVGTIAYALANGVTAAVANLGDYNRPKLYYQGRLCKQCERIDGARKDDGCAATTGLFIGKTRQYNEIGDPNKRSYCLRRVGCKGPKTQSDCSFRQWNSMSYRGTGVNWCVGAGAPCQGCVQPDFPDNESPFVNIL